MWFMNLSVKAAELCVLGKPRNLHTCISEHKGISPSTGRKLSRPSAILNHSAETSHPISDNDFSVISSSNSSYELLVRESLLISKRKPSLENISSIPLSLF